MKEYGLTILSAVIVLVVIFGSLYISKNADTMRVEDSITYIWMGVTVVSIIVFYLAFLAVVYYIAEKKGHNGIKWALLSLIISPIIVIIILAVLGETEEHRKRRIIQEEKLRESIRKGEYKENREKIVTKKSSEEEDWY